MDRFEAVMSAYGMLSLAYYLGYPVEWVISRVFVNPLNRFQEKSLHWREYNAEYDHLNSQ